MKTETLEFAPLPLERARELREVINKAARSKEAVIVDPGDGIAGAERPDLISPEENTNALVRYQRHYCPGADC
jgi:hypothetical protein